MEAQNLSATPSRSRPRDEGFRHDALFYAGKDEFAAATLSFLREGIADGEAAFVVVDAPKIRLLRSALGADGADLVAFADMAAVGRNPARIIPAWRDFVSLKGGGGRRLRGIGEPIYPSRSPAELVECQRHESLLNLAFAETEGFRLMCPYDVRAFDEPVLAEARSSHGVDVVVGDPFTGSLPEPSTGAAEMLFSAGALAPIRSLVSHHAAAVGLTPLRTADLVLAVNEVATNSLRHGGGRGRLRVWQEDDNLVCEVQDRGRIREPLLGRVRPPADRYGGRGIWMVNQLCDLVQIRSSASGTVVRMHVRRN